MTTTVTVLPEPAVRWASDALESWHLTPRVLVIEDDLNCSLVIQDYLGGHGFDVVGVRDGVWALHVAERDRPDVILLDLGLPGMHGYEVLDELRERASDARVIVITGSADPDAGVLARAMGAVRTLRKPVSLRDLISAVDSVLGS